MEIERRYGQGATTPRIEYRAISGGGSVVSGYAAVFHRSDDHGTTYRFADSRGRMITERIKAGAFDKALIQDDVIAMYSHSHLDVLGRVSSGTLRLSVDARGLRYSITMPETRNDVLELIQRGDVKGSSFSFKPRDGGQRWFQDNGVTIRDLTDLQVFDVGPTCSPAYGSTTADAGTIDTGRSVVDQLNSEDARRRRRMRARLVELGVQ